MDDHEPRRSSRLGSFFKEVGLHSLFHSALDIKLLCLQRFVRIFAYGGATLILVSYLSHLGISETQIGLFMTLTLVGDIAISLVLTLFADRLGRRYILGLGALMMAGSGVVFALSGNFVILLLAAVVGVISPSGNEIGPFRAIEESALAQLSNPAVRSDLFAWYSLTSSAGAAVGTITCGWITQRLQSNGWDIIAAYRIVFLVYAGAGLLKFALVCLMSKKVETVKESRPTRSSEEEPLLHSATPATEDAKRAWFMPHVSKKTSGLAVQLCLVFAVDSFASGLVPTSWVTYFFYQKFGLREGQLGSLFAIGFVLSAVSVLVSSSIAKRFGNVKTMAFTHMPSGVFLVLMPFPASLSLAMCFLLLRSCTQQMDLAPRSAFLAAVIPAMERTAVFGLINVVKTFSQSLGPFITGIFAKQNLFWVSFVIAGSLKLAYDISILLVFSTYKSVEEEHTTEERND